MFRKTFILVGLVILSSKLLFSQTKENNNLKLEDYFDLESVSSPQISPSGDQIIYSRRWINKYEDRSETDLWIVNSDGKNNRFLMKGGSPLWSPDGKKIAFTRQGEPRGSQIFVKLLDFDGPATQITRLDESPSGIQWSPDGRFISFVMLVPEKSRWPIEMPQKPDGAQWTEAPRIVEDLVYRRDRIGFVADGSYHIFLVPASGGTARQLTSGNWDHGNRGYSWTKDGKEIVFSSLREQDAEYNYRESEIYAVNVETGEFRQLTSRRGPDTNPVVSPDNKYIIYMGYDWTDDAYINSRYYVMNLDGSNSHLISGDFDKAASSIKWAEDNSGIFANVREKGTSNLYIIPLRGKVKKLTSGIHMLSVSSISRNGKTAGEGKG